MLSHAWDEKDAQTLVASDFVAEWKWDGIRVQAACGHDPHGAPIRKLYSRTGEDISKSFPDLVGAMHFDAVLDGELLIRRGKAVQSFNTLQQRLNRKAVTAKTMAEFPPFICVYDLMSLDGKDLRALSWRERRTLIEAFIARHPMAPLELSPLVPFDDWDALAAKRSALVTASDDEAAVEGVMIKRADSPYLAGRPKGYWYKWKLDPLVVDAVLMYAQRGHGKRSSFYSDYTFGVWNDSELVPVGKAYFGFTDEELIRIDRFVRAHTKNRFGPVREITHDPDQGLVFEIAFEGLQTSSRHKSGVAMRFPRISRIRWDKAPRDADRLEALKALLPEPA
jgi:DNA ligase-1